MKKVFKLATAEFNKIFYRPSIFILTALLIITLIVSNFYFKPTSSVTKLTYTGENVSSVYSQFISPSTSNGVINKTTIDKALDDKKAELDDTYYNIVSVDKYQEFNDKVLYLKTYYENEFLQQLILITSMSENEFLSKEKTNTETKFKQLKTLCSDLTSYLASSIKNSKLNFYIEQSNYDAIYNTILNLHDDIPISFTSYKQSDYIGRAETIRNKYDLAKIDEVVNSLEKIQLKAEDFLSIIDTYYTKPVEALQTSYMPVIDELYEETKSSNSQEDIDAINEAIAQYYSYANINLTVLTNKFMLLHIGDKTDTQLKTLVGFSEVSKYKLYEEIQLCQYLLDNSQYDYNYLTTFNFNTSSGLNTNAYDYTFFSMQILSVLIIIFTIFYACSTIAGDQSSGTMKMIAIRPYSRNKLFSGKYLSCLMFALLLLIVSFVASLIVGIVSYGITLAPCLVVFNSSTVVAISPILMMSIYFLSLLLNIIFYISLAMFLSLICKSNTLSVFLTSIIAILGIILNGLIGSVWLKFFPLAHLDLFKYFGNSKLGIFSNFILPDTSFVLSFGVIFGLIIFMNIFSHIIFKRRDIA